MEKKFYDSDIESINIGDYESDNEPPQDKIHDIKLLKKYELKRIYKKIIKVGWGLNKPARFDEVQIKVRKVDNEDETADFSNIQEENFNIGLNSYSDYFNLAIESMKKNEISLLKIEYLEYDKNNNMKVLNHNEYFQIQLLSWTTVIDLFTDKKFLKEILKKGNGYARCKRNDEVSFRYKIIVGDEVQIEKQYQKETQLLQLLEQIDEQGDYLNNSIWRIMKTMKNGEHCNAFVEVDEFLNSLDNQTPSDNINKMKQKITSLLSEEQNKIEQEPSSYKKRLVKLEIEIFNIIEIEDVFDDQMLLKRLLKKGGKNSSKPENTSIIYFDLKIFDHNDNMLYSSIQDDQQLEEEYFDEDLKNEQLFQKYIHYRMDEYKCSKLLRKAFDLMKKGELSEFICRDLTLIKYGFDYEILKQKGVFEQQIPSIRYYIKMWNFSEGKNSFTMTVDEKVENAIRKKEIGVQFIKEQKYKKALKVFENINTYFDLGNFTIEDQQKVLQHKLSSLLNTTLCQQKLQKFDELLQVVEKIFIIDPENSKCYYRKASALLEKLEYEKALQTINQYLQKENISDDTKKEFLKLQVQIKQKNQQYQDKSKQIYKNMFTT